MKASIITSILNGALHLQKCIESVKAQTVPCEHVIVDGGSTDTSLEIAREARLRVIEAPGSSISEAFNIGIKNCGGDVIAILNSDDWLEPDAVERSVRALQANPNAGFTYGAVVLHYPAHTIVVEPRVTTGDLAPYATKQMLFYHISSFVRRSVYEKHGMFDAAFKVAMDYDFYARVTSEGVCGVFVPGIVAHARAGGVSSNPRARMRDYYFVLSRYHGKTPAYFYIAKYTFNSLIYGMLSPDHAIWRLLNFKRYRQSPEGRKQ